MQLKKLIEAFEHLDLAQNRRLYTNHTNKEGDSDPHVSKYTSDSRAPIDYTVCKKIVHEFGYNLDNTPNLETLPTSEVEHFISKIKHG